MEKILVVCPSWIGDTVICSSLFQYIKYRKPDIVIDILAMGYLHEVLQFIPEVNSVIESGIVHRKLQIKRRYQLAKRIEKNEYTQAIVIPESTKSAIIPYLAKIPVRTGCSDYRRILINDRKEKLSKKKPMYIQLIDMYKDKAEKVEYEKFYPKLSADIKIIDSMNKMKKKKIFSICPGAVNGKEKVWLGEYFVEVAKYMLNNGYDVYILGASSDVYIANKIDFLCNFKCTNLAGNTSLKDVIHIIAISDGILCNDSGLMHISSALNRKTIAIYGPTPLEYMPPLSKNTVVISSCSNCTPCKEKRCEYKFGSYHRCMYAIKPDIVIDNIEKLLNTVE